MFRILALVSMVLLAALGEAWAQFGAELMTGGGVPTQVAGTTGAPPPPQQIATTTMSNESFAPGAPVGTVVGALSTSMTPATPIFDGSYSMSGTAPGCTAANSVNNVDFSPSGSNLIVNVAGLAAGSYFVCIAATEAGISNSPQGQAFALTAISGTGGAPPAALAGCSSPGGPTNGSCFSTMVWDFDPSGATACSGSGCAFPGHPNNYYETASNFVNCLGASTPEVYYENQGGYQPPCDSTHISIVNDGGTPALQLQITQTDLNNDPGGYVGTDLASYLNYSGPGMGLPLAYFREFSFREGDTDINTADDIWSYSASQIGGNLTALIQTPNANALCGSSSCQVTDVTETDFVEGSNGSSTFNYGGNNDGLGAHYDSVGGWCIADPSSNSCSGHAPPVASPSSYNNHTGYVTIGIRITNDGNGNWDQCYYYAPGVVEVGDSSSFVGCGEVCGSSYSGCGFGNMRANQNSLWRQNIVWSWGNYSGTAPATLFVAKDKVWSCSGWNTGYADVGGDGVVTSYPCGGVLLASSP